MPNLDDPMVQHVFTPMEVVGEVVDKCAWCELAEGSDLANHVPGATTREAPCEKVEAQEEHEPHLYKYPESGEVVRCAGYPPIPAPQVQPVSIHRNWRTTTMHRLPWVIDCVRCSVFFAEKDDHWGLSTWSAAVYEHLERDHNISVWGGEPIGWIYPSRRRCHSTVLHDEHQWSVPSHNGGVGDTVDFICDGRQEIEYHQEQVQPSPGQEAVQDVLIARLKGMIEALEEGKRVGAEKYGTPLFSFNGRNSLMDFAQELRDAYTYVNQVLIEGAATREQLIEVASQAMSPNVNIRGNAEFAVDAVMNWVLAQKAAGDA